MSLCRAEYLRAATGDHVFRGMLTYSGLSVSVSYKVDLVLLVFAGKDVFCAANYCAKVVGFRPEGDTQGLKQDKRVGRWWCLFE